MMPLMPLLMLIMLMRLKRANSLFLRQVTTFRITSQWPSVQAQVWRELNLEPRTGGGAGRAGGQGTGDREPGIGVTGAVGQGARGPLTPLTPLIHSGSYPL